MTAHSVALAAALGAYSMWAVPVPVLLATVMVAMVLSKVRRRRTESINTVPTRTGPINTGPIHTGSINTGSINTGPINTERVRTALIVLVVFVAVGTRGAGELAALDPPQANAFSGWVTLLDDPRPLGPIGVIATVRVDDRRLSAIAHGGAAARFDDALAGERLLLSGRVAPSGREDGFDRWRHVVGRLTVDSVHGREAGSPVFRFANAVRRNLVSGAESLSRGDRAIFLGMVIGDDRGQTVVVADDFRAAGLGHLLVVSGQNVAFVLAVVAPFAGRFRPAVRALWLFATLLLFAVITRFEPSVMRAVAMAGTGIGASVMGSPIDGKRALSWAVAALLLIDPFLVRLVAFQLSVAATAGIVWWSAPLAERLAGPRWLRVPLATTGAAQLAVSPVLLGLFGPLPLASLPANLLAGPVSGAVMVWGCTGGMIAGFFGGVVAEFLHLPSRVMLWWIGGVASRAALGPQATLGLASILLLGSAALLAVSRIRSAAVVAGVLASLVGVTVLLAAPRLGPGEHSLVGESRALVSGRGDLVLVLDDPPTRGLVESLRRSGGGRPDLVVALDGDRSDAEAVLALTERFGALAVAAPPMHRVPGGRTVQAGQTVELDDLLLRFERVAPRLVLSVAHDVR